MLFHRRQRDSGEYQDSDLRITFNGSMLVCGDAIKYRTRLFQFLMVDAVVQPSFAGLLTLYRSNLWPYSRQGYNWIKVHRPLGRSASL